MNIEKTLSDISEWFFTTVTSLLGSHEIVMIGLAGWTSFDAWYGELLQDPTWNTFDTSRIRWCVTDERINCIEKDRNDTHIWEVFLAQLCARGLSQEEYFLRPRMDSDGVEYTQRVGTIDIAFFGMGADGHTASLFPHHPALSSVELWFIKIENAPKLPPERISLSPQSLWVIRHTCLFAVWEGKKEALVNFQDVSVSIDDCPVKLLKPEIVYDKTSEMTQY
jgi:6-phosphogluconolactonase